MKLTTLIEELALENLTPEIPCNDGVEVFRAYASDLLSDVLGHAPAGAMLITVQVHLNVVAVSVHAGLTAVVFALGRRPDEMTRVKAVEEGIILLASQDAAFDIAGRMYALGVRGSDA